MAKIRPYFVSFLCLALLCLSKNASSVQILSHFRLKIKSQDEFS